MTVNYHCEGFKSLAVDLFRVLGSVEGSGGRKRHFVAWDGNWAEEIIRMTMRTFTRVSSKSWADVVNIANQLIRVWTVWLPLTADGFPHLSHSLQNALPACDSVFPCSNSSFTPIQYNFTTDDGIECTIDKTFVKIEEFWI